MPRCRSVLTLLFVALCGPLGLADEPEPATLYTNQDLLRMFGPSDEPMEPVRGPEVDLQLIERVISRAHDRLDADRRHEDERARGRDRDTRRVLTYPYWGVLPRVGFPRHDRDRDAADRVSDGCGHGAACDWDGRDAVPGPPSPRVRRHGDPLRQTTVQRANPSRVRGQKLGHKKKAGR